MPALSRWRRVRLWLVALVWLGLAGLAAAQIDPYKVLGVTRSAPIDKIKKEYKKLALKYHPDKNPDNEEAHARFLEISEAYTTLSDPVKKRDYDRHGFAANGPGGGGGGGGGGRYRYQGGHGYYARYHRYQDGQDHNSVSVRLTGDNYDEFISPAGLSPGRLEVWVVLLTQDMCATCRQMRPAWEEAAGQLRSIAFTGLIKAEFEAGLVRQLRVRSVPTVIAVSIYKGRTTTEFLSQRQLPSSGVYTVGALLEFASAQFDAVAPIAHITQRSRRGDSRRRSKFDPVGEARAWLDNERERRVRVVLVSRRSRPHHLFHFLAERFSAYFAFSHWCLTCVSAGHQEQLAQLLQIDSSAVHGFAFSDIRGATQGPILFVQRSLAPPGVAARALDALRGPVGGPAGPGDKPRGAAGGNAGWQPGADMPRGQYGFAALRDGVGTDRDKMVALMQRWRHPLVPRLTADSLYELCIRGQQQAAAGAAGDVVCLILLVDSQADATRAGLPLVARGSGAGHLGLGDAWAPRLDEIRAHLVSDGAEVSSRQRAQRRRDLTPSTVRSQCGGARARRLVQLAWLPPSEHAEFLSVFTEGPTLKNADSPKRRRGDKTPTGGERRAPPVAVLVDMSRGEFMMMASANAAPEGDAARRARARLPTRPPTAAQLARFLFEEYLGVCFGAERWWVNPALRDRLIIKVRVSLAQQFADMVDWLNPLSYDGVRHLFKVADWLLPGVTTAMLVVLVAAFCLGGGLLV